MNEGSTKPTELERALDIMTEKYKSEHGYVESAREERDQIAKTCDLLRAENSRVRGLLQRRDQDWRDLIQDAIGQWGGPQYKFFKEAMARIWEAKKQFDKGLDVCGNPLEPNFPQSSSLVPQGAESADIGKLETADKRGKVVWIAKCTTGHCRWMEMCKHVQNEENAIHRLAKHSELHMDGATGRVYSLTLAEGVEMGKVNRVEEPDAVCSGCHTRACNGECMRPMRFKGDTR